MKMTVQVIPMSNRDPTLMAFCSFTIDDKFQVGDVGLHFRDGRYYLLYPTKRLRSGFLHYFRPIDGVTDEAMTEEAVRAYKKALSERDSEREAVHGETREH